MVFGSFLTKCPVQMHHKEHYLSVAWLELDRVTQLQISDSPSLLLLRHTVKQVFGVIWLCFSFEAVYYSIVMNTNV